MYQFFHSYFQILPGSKVVIADPDTLGQCSDSRLGEIWVHSPHTAHGYFSVYGGDSSISYDNHFQVSAFKFFNFVINKVTSILFSVPVSTHGNETLSLRCFFQRNWPLVGWLMLLDFFREKWALRTAWRSNKRVTP